MTAWLWMAGCTFQPGEGFTSLEAVTLVPHVGERQRVTDLGHTLVIDAMALEASPLALETLEGGGSAFDPANPPPGYSDCHDGHCHASDGSLPSYAEIEATLAGGNAVFRTVAQVWWDPVDLLGGPVDEADVSPARALPPGALGQATLPLLQLQIAARVTSVAPEVPLDMTLDLTGHALASGLDLVVDRDAPPSVGLLVELDVPLDLFDGVDWPTADLADEDLEHALVDAMAEAHLHVEVAP